GLLSRGGIAGRGSRCRFRLDRGTQSRLVLPDLGQEGHEAPKLVEVARPVLECHAEAVVDEPRHPPYPLREEPPILTAIDDRDEVGTSPLDDDLASPDLKGSQLVRGPFCEGVRSEERRVG